MIACDFCGKVPESPPDESADREADLVPLAWVTSIENGRPKVYCDDCARTNLRAIESKLDAEWW